MIRQKTTAKAAKCRLSAETKKLLVLEPNIKAIRIKKVPVIPHPS
jgi:hypothetical protein